MYLEESQIRRQSPAPDLAVRDRLGRPLRDLRLSVIDRCNLRCGYCMPAESLNGQGVFLPTGRLLCDEELERLVRVFSKLGVRKLRLTGGEPLLRPGFAALVERLSAVDGIDDLALTTNAVLLPRMADDLAKAGLGRITVSLDSVDEQVFRTMSGGRSSVAEVLAGIDAAVAAGFSRLKINTVVQRGANDEHVLDLVSHFRGSGHTVRLIEFMDVGSINHWDRESVVPSAELLKRIHDRWPLRPVLKQAFGETARRYEFVDGAGEVGFISSITEPFCGDCTRARVTADGVLYSCLFSANGTPLRSRLRSGASDDEMLSFVEGLWRKRSERYSELRNGATKGRGKAEMFRLGG